MRGAWYEPAGATRNRRRCGHVTLWPARNRVEEMLVRSFMGFQGKREPLTKTAGMARNLSLHQLRHFLLTWLKK